MATTVLVHNKAGDKVGEVTGETFARFRSEQAKLREAQVAVAVHSEGGNASADEFEGAGHSPSRRTQANCWRKWHYLGRELGRKLGKYFESTRAIRLRGLSRASAAKEAGGAQATKIFCIMPMDCRQIGHRLSESSTISAQSKQQQR